MSLTSDMLRLRREIDVLRDNRAALMYSLSMGNLKLAAYVAEMRERFREERREATERTQAKIGACLERIRGDVARISEEVAVLRNGFQEDLLGAHYAWHGRYYYDYDFNEDDSEEPTYFRSTPSSPDVSTRRSTSTDVKSKAGGLAQPKVPLSKPNLGDPSKLVKGKAGSLLGSQPSIAGVKKKAGGLAQPKVPLSKPNLGDPSKQPVESKVGSLLESKTIGSKKKAVKKVAKKVAKKTTKAKKVTKKVAKKTAKAKRVTKKVAKNPSVLGDFLGE